MAVATFDTLKFANTLKAAGVPDKQAEAQAVAFAEVIQINLKDLVTKDDLRLAKEDLERSIDGVRKELTQQFDTKLQKLDSKIDLLDQRLMAKFQQVQWVGGVLVIFVLAVLGLLIRLSFFAR